MKYITIRKTLCSTGSYTGRLTSALVIFIVAISSSLNCARSAESQKTKTASPSALALDAKIDEGHVQFTITNRSQEKIDIAYPFMLSVGRSLGGLEIVFRKIGAKKSDAGRLCAMIDLSPDYLSKKYSLLPNAVIGFRFELDQIRQFYCLERGEYQMEAKYHNVLEAVELGSDPAPITRTIKL